MDKCLALTEHCVYCKYPQQGSSEHVGMTMLYLLSMGLWENCILFVNSLSICLLETTVWMIL